MIQKWFPSVLGDSCQCLNSGWNLGVHSNLGGYHQKMGHNWAHPSYLSDPLKSRTPPIITHQAQNTGPISKWLLFLYGLPFHKIHIKPMPSGCPITQIWSKLRGSPHIWVNPQIWVISETDHLELREVTLGPDQPELSASPIFEGHDDVIKWKHFPRYRPFVRGPATGEFPSQRPVTRSFYVFFDLRPNKRLSKQLWGWWFETLSRPLWRHCNGGHLPAYCTLAWWMLVCITWGKLLLW